jgi:hypothetical protein
VLHKSKFPRVRGKLPTNTTGKWKMTGWFLFPLLEKVRPRRAAPSLCLAHLSPLPPPPWIESSTSLCQKKNRAPPLPPSAGGVPVPAVGISVQAQVQATGRTCTFIPDEERGRWGVDRVPVPIPPRAHGGPCHSAILPRGRSKPKSSTSSSTSEIASCYGRRGTRWRSSSSVGRAAVGRRTSASS